MGVAQVRYTAMRCHGGSASRATGASACACGTRDTAALCSWRRVRAQRYGAATSVGVCLCGRMCAPQGPPGSEDRALGEQAAEEHSVLCAVLSCGRPVNSLAATTTEAVGKLLVPATQHGAGCGVRCQAAGAGVTGSTYDGVACAADAIAVDPRLRRERVRWGAAMAKGSAPGG